MYIYDSVLKSKVEFKPNCKENVNIYLCGVTVYDDVHIGHVRSAVVFDLLHRVLIYNGYGVNFIKNFTDIDDKILLKMKTTGLSLSDITNKYINAYKRDFKPLNILEQKRPKATDYINDMIDNINRLIDTGYAYKTDNGDIYFNSSKDSNI